MNRIYLLIIVLFLVLGCSKEETVTVNYYSNYFPVDIGRFVTYKVNDHIYSTIGEDSSTYYLKEKIVENFIDNEGDLAQRLERYKADSLNGDFVLTDVWVVKKNNLQAVKLEENIDYVKLQFPIETTASWDGNAFNAQDEQTYSYDSLFASYSINNLYFDSTVKVVQMDNYNAVQYQQWSEVYAANIGMIYKEFTDLSINQFDVTDINEGRVLTMSVVAYGKE